LPVKVRDHLVALGDLRIRDFVVVPGIAQLLLK
jgi:hypothetical protein